MMGLISFMFALSTLLWVARLESDIEIMLDLLNGTSKARNQARLMSNVLALFNVSVPACSSVVMLMVQLGASLSCPTVWSCGAPGPSGRSTKSRCACARRFSA